MKTALLFCVIAALGYGGGAVLQALGARRASAKGHNGLLQMVREPIFLLGVLADFGSWLISRFALHTLPLFAVQTILAGSLAVTVLLARYVLGATLGRLEKMAVGATMIGLVIVGISAGEETAKGISDFVKFGILLGIPATTIVAVFAVKLGKPTLLAVLAGAAFTGSAMAARAVDVGDASFVHLLTRPLVWAVLIYAVMALVMHAIALLRGHVGPVTAAMWATEVVVSTVVGALFLGDHMRDGWLVPAIVGICLTLAATVVLARSPAQDLDHRNLPLAVARSGDGPGSAAPGPGPNAATPDTGLSA